MELRLITSVELIRAKMSTCDHVPAAEITWPEFLRLLERERDSTTCRWHGEKCYFENCAEKPIAWTDCASANGTNKIYRDKVKASKLIKFYPPFSLSLSGHAILLHFSVTAIDANNTLSAWAAFILVCSRIFDTKVTVIFIDALNFNALASMKASGRADGRTRYAQNSCV